MSSRCRSTAPAPMSATGSIVEDHARALELVVDQGRVGESYNVGGRAERTNLSVVESDLRHSRQQAPARAAASAIAT